MSHLIDLVVKTDQKGLGRVFVRRTSLVNDSFCDPVWKDVTLSFNIISQPYQVVKWPSSTNTSSPEFGRSVALFNQKIYIGAPKAPHGGAVYECTVTANETEQTCIRMGLRSKARNMADDMAYDSSSESLGAAVAVSRHGHLVACAPRFQIRLDCQKDKSTGANVCQKWRPNSPKSFRKVSYYNLDYFAQN